MTPEIVTAIMDYFAVGLVVGASPVIVMVLLGQIIETLKDIGLGF